MGVPYTFATATTSIPLSELDANFNTQITIGTSTVGLGNTTTSLVGLSNVSTTLLVATTANVTTENVTTSNATNLTVTNDASISGLTVGKGGGSQSNNSAFGNSALTSNTTGNNNTAVGSGALQANTTGNYSTAVGRWAGYYNTTGYVTAFGNQAGYSNTTATDVTAIGGNALVSNTTGGYNTALGSQALYSNTTASNNTAVGYQALYTNSTGTTSTALGYKAGYATTAGGNVFVGDSAGVAQTSGSGSTFIGSTSGSLVTTGNNNTILGRYSGNQGGLDIRTSSNYIVLSDGDGNPRVTVNNNGNLLLASSATSGEFAGSSVKVQISADRPLALKGGSSGGNELVDMWHPATSGTRVLQYFTAGSGNTYVGEITTDGSTTSYSSASDYRLKENIVPMTGALDKVAQLKPCTYTWKTDGKNGQGFIAHELQAIIPDCVVGEKDAVNEDGTPRYQSVDTSFLVATLTAALQEAHGLIKDLQTRVAALEAKLGA